MCLIHVDLFKISNSLCEFNAIDNKILWLYKPEMLLAYLDASRSHDFSLGYPTEFIYSRVFVLLIMRQMLCGCRQWK